MSDRHVIEDLDLTSVSNMIQEIYESVYDDPTKLKKGDKFIVRNKGRTDSTVIKMIPGDGIEVNTGAAKQTVKSRVAERFGDTELRERQRDRTPSPADDNVGPVFKPFSHEKADYRSPGDPGFDPNHERCETCAHYDDNGHCRIVPDIEPDGYCAEFYSDVGIFMHAHDDFVEVNLALWSEIFDWDGRDLENAENEVGVKLAERAEID